MKIRIVIYCLLCCLFPCVAMASITPPPPTPAVPDPGIFTFWTSSKKGWCKNSPSKGMLSSGHANRSNLYMTELLLWYGEVIAKSLLQSSLAIQSSIDTATQIEKINAKDIAVAHTKNQGHLKSLEKKMFSTRLQCPDNVGYAYQHAKTQQEILNSVMAAEDKYIGEGWLMKESDKEKFFGGFDHAIKTTLKLFPESGTMSDKQLAVFNAWRGAMFPLTQDPEISFDDHYKNSHHIADSTRIRENRVILGEALRRWGISKAGIIPAEFILEWVGPYMSRPQFDVSIVEMPSVGTKVGTPQAKRVDPIKNNKNLYTMITKHANNHGLDPHLVAAVVAQESGGNPHAQHPGSGAAGLMQLMPGTARELGLTVTKELDERFEAEKNLDAGCRYLKQRINQFGGNIIAALASYNWGPGHVNCYMKHGHGMIRVSGKLQCLAEKGSSLPPETYSYTASIYGIPASAMRSDSQIDTSTHVVAEREIQTFVDEMPVIEYGDMISTDTLYDLIGKRFTSENFLVHMDGLNDDAVMHELIRLHGWMYVLENEIKNDLALSNILRSMKSLHVFNISTN